MLDSFQELHTLVLRQRFASFQESHTIVLTQGWTTKGDFIKIITRKVLSPSFKMINSKSPQGYTEKKKT